MFSDSDRDVRTGDQWLLSVVSYLEFSAGLSWRKTTSCELRFNETRFYYLQPIQLIKNLRYATVPACECSRCGVSGKKPNRGVRLNSKVVSA